MFVSNQTVFPASFSPMAGGNSKSNASSFAEILKQELLDLNGQLDLDTLIKASRTRQAFLVQSQRLESEEKSRETERQYQAYETLLQKAYTEQAYLEPLKFVQSLSETERETLRVVHALVNPIQTHKLSTEAALNLLLPHELQRDFQRDGEIEIADAKVWRFPPADAPLAVKEAWKQATQHLDEGEKLHLQLFFKPMSTAEQTLDYAKALGKMQDEWTDAIEAGYSLNLARDMAFVRFLARFAEQIRRQEERLQDPALRVSALALTSPLF